MHFLRFLHRVNIFGTFTEMYDENHLHFVGFYVIMNRAIAFSLRVWLCRLNRQQYSAGPRSGWADHRISGSPDNSLRCKNRQRKIQSTIWRTYLFSVFKRHSRRRFPQRHRRPDCEILFCGSDDDGRVNYTSAGMKPKHKSRFPSLRWCAHYVFRR